MENRDYLELTFRSISCFADDGKLDVAELDSLLHVAKRDGVIDDNEKRVLGNIISKIREEEIDGELAKKIAEIEELI